MGNLNKNLEIAKTLNEGDYIYTEFTYRTDEGIDTFNWCKGIVKNVIIEWSYYDEDNIRYNTQPVIECSFLVSKSDGIEPDNGDKTIGIGDKIMLRKMTETEIEDFCEEFNINNNN